MALAASVHEPFFPDGEEPILADALDTGRPDTTLALTRGVWRLMADMGLAVIPEFKLANGRRADLCGVCPKGEIVIVEIKSCWQDLAADTKWPDYRDYCDRFFFGVNEIFPLEKLPEDEGVIVADAFGGAILRDSGTAKLAGARRKATMLRFARQAAFGWAAV